jgi:Tfp pilus assembly protein PilZ
VFVATESPLPPGSDVTLELRLDAALLPWRVSGVVRWARPQLNASLEHSAGCGVQFQTLPLEAEAAIRALILNQRESLYFEDGA